MVQPARSSAKATTRRALKGEPRNSLVKFYLGGIILSTLESRNESHPNQGGELGDKESRSENVRTGEKDPEQDSAIGEGRPEDPPADATG
jgi:hypothetical protein